MQLAARSARPLLALALAGALLMTTAAALGAAPTASDPDTAGIAAVFTRGDAALAAGDEAAYRATWLAASWSDNLVGGSGLPGQAVFSQGHRKGWFLKPDMDAMTGTERGAPWIVPCDIWSREGAKAVDHVFAAVIWDQGAWIILGAGEDKAEVQALAARWLAKAPLAPPKKD